MRYVFLALLIYLVVQDFLRERRDPSDTRLETVSRCAVSTMLLLNHLAFQFDWPPVVMAIVRVAALTWCFVGLLLILGLPTIEFASRCIKAAHVKLRPGATRATPRHLDTDW